MAQPRYTDKFLVALTHEQKAYIEYAADMDGISMADVIREAIDAQRKATGPIIWEVSAVTDDGADEDPRSDDEREQDEAAADWAGQTADLRGGL